MTAALDRGPMRIESERLLLVEGPDDRNLFEALIRHRFGGDPPDVQVVEAGGSSAFKARIDAVRRAARQAGKNLRTLCIVRDADLDPAGAWQSVRGAVASSNLQPPDRHAAFSDASPSVGIFIMPDGVSKGTLETLCRRSVADEPAADCVERYLTCLDEHDATSSRNRDKSFAHAYLASRRDPVARVGEAAQQDVWDFDHPAFAALVRLLYSLSGTAASP